MHSIEIDLWSFFFFLHRPSELGVVQDPEGARHVAEDIKVKVNGTNMPLRWGLKGDRLLSISASPNMALRTSE